MTVKPYVLTERGFLRSEQVVYPMEERGLQFGDGVYEVVRLYSGTYIWLHEHLDRLYRSAAAIRLAVPFSHEELAERLEQLRRMNDVREDAILYLQVTRGASRAAMHFRPKTGRTCTPTFSRWREKQRKWRAACARF